MSTAFIAVSGVVVCFITVYMYYASKWIFWHYGCRHWV